MKVIFFGSDDFSFSVLSRISDKCEIVAIVSVPNKGRGRNRKKRQLFTGFSVKKSIGLFLPEYLDADFANLLKKYAADIFLVVSYGKILPAHILSIPKYAVNVHPSLLPKYRGASPIQSAILNGDKNTGVSFIIMNEKLDSGDIFFQKEFPIGENDTAKDILDTAADIASEEICPALERLLCGKCKILKQDNNKATYASRIKKSDALINWGRKAEFIYNSIRAYNPWPVAYTYFRGKMIKVFSSVPLKNDVYNNLSPGVIAGFDKSGVIVKCGKGLLKIKMLQPENKKVTDAYGWVNGVRLKAAEESFKSS